MSSWFDRLLEDLQRRQLEQMGDGDGGPRPPRPGRRSRPFPPAGRGPSVLRWLRLSLLAVVAIVLLLLATGAVDLLTDLAWYDALGLRAVILTRLWAHVGWFAAGFVLFALPSLISIAAAIRLVPASPIRVVGAIELPDASRPVAIGAVLAALLGGLVSGAAWGGNWLTILLFANGGDFGTQDATFGRDIGFYVFDLPFWRFVQGWAVAALAAILVLTLAVYLARALRWSVHLTPALRVHVSLLGAGLLVAIAAGYQLDSAALVYSTRGIGGAVQAAMYTDVHAQIPAYLILTGVALLAAALLLANIWFRTLWLMGLAAGAWIALSVLVGGIYPAVVQRFSVEPNELAVERPFLADHLAATRAAYGLDAIAVRSFTGERPLTRSVIDENADTVANLRLWDYRPLLATFGQQQILRQYYDFLDVDIDRYQIGGAPRQLMLSGREIAVDRLAGAAQTWTNQRLVYTHGYGITAVPSNAITPEGQPDYLISGINRQPEVPVRQPRLYFGEGTTTYVVVRTRTDEFDFPLGEEGGEITSWQGTTGVRLSGPLTRLLFAVRFGDLNLLISNQLTDDSVILFRRAIAERVPEIAPFLAYDRDPYLVSADDRLVWIWDAYTVSDRYPNAQPLPTDVPLSGANYVRNSVKVVIDAYSGEMRFFVADPDDPIIGAYGRIFPDLFEPMSAMPAALVPHLRYPEDLFLAQNHSYLLYHVPATDEGAATFYNQEDRWAFATEQADVAGESRLVEPYYVIMKIPGESGAEFVLIQPLVAASRLNMISWMVARMDPGVYGQRMEFRFPSDTTTLGPAQVQARINQDSRISAQFTLWSQAGSDVVRGNLLVLPMGDSLMYVEPIYLRSTQASFPEFKRVILASQTRIAFAEDVETALAQLLGEATVPEPGGAGGGGGGGGGELPGDVAALVALAQQLYDEAQQALAAGDLGTYQDRIDAMNAVLDRLSELVSTPAPSPGG